MHFRSRKEAAELLADRLAHLRGHDPLVLAVPRGAVPMGQTLAEALDGDLDVVLVHKLRAPGNPELAIGAVGETGEVLIAEHAEAMNVPSGYLRAEIRHQLEALQDRRRDYTGSAPLSDPRGRITVVMDDGVATGSTLTAALRLLHARAPDKLIAAVAVAPADTLGVIEQHADEVVCLHAPRIFFSVSQFFDDFSQVTDDDVLTILRQAQQRRTEVRS